MPTDTAPVQSVDGFDAPLFLTRANRDDDLVGRERRESIAYRDTDVCLAGDRLDGLPGELLGGLLGDCFGPTERLLVVREPVEDALSHDRHDDLDRVGLADMLAQDVLRMLDRADDEDVPAH